MFKDINFNDVYKATFSISKSEYKKATVKRIKLHKQDVFQLELFTDKQAFHKNFTIDEAYLNFLDTMNYFSSVEIFSKEFIYRFKVTNKGKVLSNKSKNLEKFVIVNHNKEKNYLIEEGMIVEPLIDLNVMTKDGHVSKSYYDKFKQINKFLEIIDDTIKNDDKEEFNIIDFGCGKSYLTFVVYYYFTKIKHKKVNMVGLDLKKDVINKCNQIRDKYHYDNLNFEIGDISLYKPKTDVDMIITLHACDTATDFAMYHAIMLNCKYLLSVPCCQHEINLQLKKNNNFILTSYGILKERYSALLTDTIRAKILEYKGYKTDVMEFIDFAHTPKNLLIRAIKTANSNQEALDEVSDTLNKLNIHQTLYDLIIKK